MPGPVSAHAPIVESCHDWVPDRCCALWWVAVTTEPVSAVTDPWTLALGELSAVTVRA